MIDLPIRRGYEGFNRVSTTQFLRMRPLWLKYDGDNTLTDCQVKCVLTPSDIPFEKLRSDKKDILFVDKDNELIPHWVEKIDNEEIVVWLKFSRIIPTTKEVFWLYYGNGNFQGASNGYLTFDFFDEFDGEELDTTKWQTFGTFDVLEVTNGELHAKTEQGNALVVSKSTYNRNIVIESKVKLVRREVGQAHLVQDIDNWINNYYYESDKWYERIKKRESGSETILAEEKEELSYNTYYLLKTILKSSDIIFKIYDMDGNLKVTVTTSDTTWSSGYVGFRTYGSSDNPSEWYVDRILVRKYLDLEPLILT